MFGENKINLARFSDEALKNHHAQLLERQKNLIEARASQKDIDDNEQLILEAHRERMKRDYRLSAIKGRYPS